MSFYCRLARDDGEIARYRAIRRDIFCREQGVYDEDDGDEWDALALPIVCVETEGALVESIVGVVRIYRAQAQTWYGGRLGVIPSHRRLARVGRLLVRTAVSTATGLGATRFLATVQDANVPFFRQMRWHTLSRLRLQGRGHHLMQAELAHYPPLATTVPARFLPRLSAAPRSSIDVVALSA